MSIPKCEKIAAYRYTWPMNEEKYICEDHVLKLHATAKAMGLYLQIIPMTVSEIISGLTCSQIVDKGAERARQDMDETPAITSI